MSGYLCLKLSPPPPPSQPPPSTLSKHHLPLRNTLLGAALSFGLLFSFPSVSALQLPSQPCPHHQPPQETLQTAPEVVTNQGLVEEAWQIVNDTFLDTGRHRWSQDTWQLKREAILSNSIQTRSKAHQIIKRMLSGLGDPYTRFLSPDEFSKMARYDMTGVGINLKEVPDENGNFRLEVLGIILDGPAHSAGVRQGDEILAVNNMEVKGKSAFEVSSLLQGPSGTSVTIQVKHGYCGPVESIEVQRQLVARTPVFYRLEQLDNGVTPVGYIRLKEFNALARKDLVIAMKRLQDMGASYFILDLRDNLGGLVQAGIEIAKLFLNEGDTVIYTVGRDPQLQKTIVSDTSPLIQAPVVVLVNDKTASASEIVASALHDNCRAVLVGKRTYGKGLIQSVFELDDGSGVVITVGKYVTPHHKDINGNGIEPDFQKLPALDDISQHLKKCSMPQQG
ncbi:carboxyl-terminal-processing peptidase 1, chloroplastic [Vigna unguiculata]|uniref:C-terminal processing peptidase n=1 Tax=Vigna unguiculata TaxID=3917 RepID=A0A4D6L7Q4_VIGUN|nr:carboxyl-terminal-processing peptidase 1, chloroplastic [Vigna unguiculata]QCD84541.1 carboxyl-terminal processing protease [Vigna unguiculata]